MSDYYEAAGAERFDPAEILRHCVENGVDVVMLDGPAVPEEFFDLSSGVAGELLHKLSVYRLRLAAVVPDPTVHTPDFQAFVREANRGDQFRFFASRDEALSWIESL